MRMLLPALTLTLALAGAAAHAADNGIYVGAGVSQVKLDNVGDNFDTGDLNDFKLDDTSWKLIGGFRPLDNFAVELNYIDLGNESRSVGNARFEVDGKAYGAYAVGLLPIGPIDLFAKGGLVRWESKPASTGHLASVSTTMAPNSGMEPAFRRVWAAWLPAWSTSRFDVDNTDGVELLTLGVTWTFL